MMRLCKLKLRNFISHVDTEIDFENILDSHNSNFILISGNTGSGKSSILDGLIAGLYGIGKGNKSLIGGREPLSDYSNSKQWEIEVEFIINNKRYKVVRRGSTVKWFVKETDTFKRLSAEPPLPIKDGKIARQVMVIPQGEYIQLLTAKRKDRKDILLKLINIDWLKKFIEEMKRRRYAINQQVKSDANALKTFLLQALNNAKEIQTLVEQEKFANTLDTIDKWIEEIESIDIEKEPEELLRFIDSKKIVETLNDLLNELKQERVTLKKLIEQKESTKTHWVTLKTRIEDLNTPLTEANQTLEKLRDLESQRENIYKLEIQLTELKQIERLFKDSLDNLDKITREISELNRQINVLQKDVKRLEEEEQILQNIHQIASKIFESVNTKVTKLINDLQHLYNLLSNGKTYYEQWQNAETQRNFLAQIMEKVEQLQKFADLSGNLKPYIETITNLKREINQAKQEKERKEKELQKVEHQLSKLKHTLRDIENQLTQLKIRKDEISRNLEDLKDNRQRLETERQRVEENYREIIIAELSSQLKPGEPCPICGSTEHPKPASIRNFSAEDLKRTLEKRKELKAHIERIDKQIKKLETELKHTENKLQELTEQEKQEQQVINEQQRILTALSTEIKAKKEELQQKANQLEANKQTLSDEIKTAGIGTYDKLKSSNISVEDYAQWLINQLQQDWETLMAEIQQIGITPQTSQLSVSTAGAIKDAIQRKLNEIERLKEQFDNWKRDTYTRLVKQIAQDLIAIHNDIEVFTNHLYNSGRQTLQPTDLIQLLKDLKIGIEAIGGKPYFTTQDYIDFSQISEFTELAETLKKHLTNLKQATDTLNEKLQNVKKSLSEQRGKLAQLGQSITDKRQMQSNLEQQIETNRKKNNISFSIEKIRQKLVLLDKQDKWQREITMWKTRRKTTFENLINDFSQLYRKLQESLEPSIIPELPSLDLNYTELENTNFNLKEFIEKFDQWLQQATKIITKCTEELTNNINNLQAEIANLQKRDEAFNSLITTIKQDNVKLTEQNSSTEKSIKENAAFMRLFRLVGVEASNKKGSKPSLEHWITQFILNKMLRNASPYLKEFTDGRLEFVVSESGTQDIIQIVDYSYGKVRNVNDLSGGEKFMSALSLALGLTDLLIQFEQNASRPNFMFIDEGFGTLDAERLEKVVYQLKTYAEKHDILLGVISHRQEMHSMAPVRIHVTHDRTRKGSAIQIIYS